MCYDISYKITLDSIQEYFSDIDFDPQIEMDFELTVHILAQAFRKHPVIIREDGKYKLKYFEWGVIADYMNTPEKIKKGRALMCNAQAEKILDDKRSYWHRIRRKRCLIPVNGIYEHREIKGWKNKVPYYVQLKDRPMFCLPGLYQYSPIPDVETGEVKGTFTVITRKANPLMARIHNCGLNSNRMPLFLTRELEKKWLEEDLTDEGIRSVIEFEWPASEMIAWPVASIRTTKQRMDGRSKNEPFEWENLPPLFEDAV